MASVSIVIAAYCGEKFIIRQLESLFRQTRLPDEIIICDDSPNDLLADLVMQRAKTAPCTIKFFKNERQLGSTQNFAKGLALASSDIIFLCDQDDVWKENKVERLTAALEEHKECDVVFCNSVMVDYMLDPLGYVQCRGRPALGRKDERHRLEHHAARTAAPLEVDKRLHGRKASHLHNRKRRSLRRQAGGRKGKRWL